MPADKAGRDRLHISLDAGNLSGKKTFGMRTQLQRGIEKRRGIDVRVAVDLPVAKELRVLQPGNQTQDSFLLRESQMVLEPHQVVAVGAQILLPQLHRSPGTPPGARIGQAHRLHRTEAQRIAAAARDLFDRQTGFEIGDIVRDMRLNRLRRISSSTNRSYSAFDEWAVEIIARAVERLVVA